MKGLSVHFFHFVRINAHNSIVSFISLYLYFDSLVSLEWKKQQNQLRLRPQQPEQSFLN